MKTTTHWKQISVPELMKKLPLDDRGYPVPFIVFRDKNGIPNFKINDKTKVDECVKKDLCSICGNTLNENKWVVGGPLSAFHPNGAFYDAPMHRECCEYALQVCPYMAFSQYKAAGITDSIVNLAKDNGMFLINSTQDMNRVPLFVMCKIRNFEFRSESQTEWFVIPEKPYLEVHYWNDGIELDEKTAIEIIRANSRA